MFLFRSDGNSDIGAGHVMRCLSIADMLLEEGEKSIFVTVGADFKNEINRHGHEDHILYTDYNNMISETEEIGRLLHCCQPEAVFVDSYFVTGEYLEFLHHLCHEMRSALVYMDDIMAFAYPCDILVNYNIYGPGNAERYKELYSNAGMKLPELLLGPRYAPLRAEFRNLPHRELRKKVQNVLISTGGADAEHMGLKIIEAIKRYEEKGKIADICFHFVIGVMNEDKEKIEEASKKISSVKLHYNISNMGELMQSCDAAISAAGSTLYELCATKTPGNTYILADNQIPGAEGFEHHGLLKNCGDVRKKSPEELAEKLLEETMNLVQNYDERVRIKTEMGRMVDGYGAGRIVKAVKRRHEKI